MKSEKSKSLNKVGRICSAITMSSFKPNKSNEIKQRSHSIKYLSMTGQQLLDSPRRIIKAKRKVPLIFTNDLSSEGTSVSEDTP